MILAFDLMQISQRLDHTFCIPEDQDIRDPGIGIVAVQFHAGKPVSQKTHSGVQFRKLPAPLQGDGVGFGFDGIVFLKLLFQRGPQTGTQTGIQQTADFDLADLGGFQKGREKLLASFHGASPTLLCTIAAGAYIKWRTERM